MSNGSHSLVATAGQRHPSANQRFLIGGVTNTFTAALVMQLVDQHRLRLDDSLARYLPGVVPEGSKITINPGYNPLLTWAAGAIVSNTNDLSRFFQALLAARVVSKTAVTQMEQSVPANTVFGLWQGDGLGILSTQLPCGKFWGHDGLILDYSTIVEASPRGRVGVISVRSDNWKLPNPNMATLLCS